MVQILESMKKVIPLEKLYMLPTANRRQTTVLKRGEVVTEVRIPVPEGGRGVFLKEMERKAWSFALASVALQVNPEGNRIADSRMVLGGVAPVPWRAKEAERALRGQKLSEDLIQRVGEAALSGAQPMRDNAYKVEVVKSLIGKALTEIAAQS